MSGIHNAPLCTASIRLFALRQAVLALVVLHKGGSGVPRAAGCALAGQWLAPCRTPEFAQIEHVLNTQAYVSDAALVLLKVCLGFAREQSHEQAQRTLRGTDVSQICMHGNFRQHRDGVRTQASCEADSFVITASTHISHCLSLHRPRAFPHQFVRRNAWCATHFH